MPRLTTETTEKVGIFFEWALDIRFTPEQKQQFETYVLRDWNDAERRKSTLQLAQLTTDVIALPEETRKQAQLKLNRALLDQLRATIGDPESSWLLAIYENSHKNAEPVAAAAVTPVRLLTPEPRLLGKWRAGSVATTQYYNAYTGTPAPTSGSTFAYDFQADGAYHMSGLLQITTYGCTSSVWRDNSGTYRVEGNRLYLQPAQGIVKSRVCGGQESTKEDKRELAVQSFHFESNSQGDQLVMDSVDRKSRPDYFRREK